MADKETVKRVQEIISSAFPNNKDDEYTPGAVESAFSQLEDLGPAALEAVSVMLTDSRIHKLLVAAGEPAFKYLEHALKEGKRSEQDTAVQILGEIPSIEMLESVMRNRRCDENVRAEAACQLGLNQEIEILGKALTEGEEGLRVAAAKGLDAIILRIHPGQQPDASHEPVISLFIKALEDGNATVRQYAVNNLERVGRLTVDMITKALHDESADVRKGAVWALFNVGIDQSTSLLLAEAVEDKTALISDIAIDNITRWDNRKRIQPRVLADAIIDILVLRESNLPSQKFNPERTARAIQQTIDLSPPLRERILTRLCDLAYGHEDSVRTRSVRVARRLGQADFLALVQERSAEKPSAARAILRLLGDYSDTDVIIRQLAEAAPGDVQSIAALQTKLLQEYYENALEQTKTSFKWAVVSTMIGLGCLVLTVVYLLITVLIATEPPDLLGILAGISSVLSQFIAGGQFWLYDRAGKRLAQSQMQLYQVQRFQLANNVCESLEGELQQRTRSELVKLIADVESDAVELPMAAIEPSVGSTS